jgi:hypothetical protein
LDESFDSKAEREAAQTSVGGAIADSGGGGDALATASATAVEQRGRHAWSLASAVCLIAAVPFLLTGRLEVAFVVATLGVVAWFLNLRSQLKPTRTERDGRPGGKRSMDEDDGDED